MGKRKFTADQAREALLSTGLEMLQSIGPAGVATVSLAEAINRSGVPRPSAYRVFGGGDLDPQGSFQEQLVLRVIELEPGMDYDLLHQRLGPLLAEINNADAQLSEAELTQSLLRALKLAADTVITYMIESPHTGVHLSAMALIRTGDDSRRIEAAVSEHRDLMANRYGSLYRDLMSAFGLRLRAGWTDQDLFVVFNDATIGAVMASKASSGADALSGAMSSLAATFVALTALATEPDPRRVVAAQPLNMMTITPRELVVPA